MLNNLWQKWQDLPPLNVVTASRAWDDDWRVIAQQGEDGVIAVQFRPARKQRESIDLPCDVEPVLELA